jgi:WXG100 family type VII secretion target
MAIIHVTTSKLAAEAQNIERYKKELDKQIQEFESAANRYLSYWEGPAKDAFVKAVQKHANLLHTFSNNTLKFANALKQSGSTYENAETKAIRIAGDK